jgi:hypothetical protein
MKTLTCLMAGLTLGCAMLGPLDQARADGHGIAAGLLGGLAAGAIIGSALAPRPYYGPGPVYVAPAPAYMAPQPVYVPTCYWTPGAPMWNGYGWVRPRVRTCD